MMPNALWLDIRPQAKGVGAWARKKNLFFAVPSDREHLANGDRNAWIALNILMHIAPEGNFPQRCAAPLPKGSLCGSWFVKVAPGQHACSERCRQRKHEATAEYKEAKAKYAKKHRKDLKTLEQKGLEIVKQEASRGKKR